MDDLNDFVDINGYEGLYKINKKGEVYSCRKNIILKGGIGTEGYLKFCFVNKNSENNMKPLHRLLGIQFIPNPNNYEFIDHLDNNKLNNNLDNLRWIDKSGNSRNYKKKRKYDLPTGVYTRGKKFVVRMKLNKKTTHIGTFNTIEEASEAYEKKYDEIMSQY